MRARRQATPAGIARAPEVDSPGWALKATLRPLHGWFTDDTPKRFEAYGWHVQDADGHDAAAIATAFAMPNAARAQAAVTLIARKSL